MLNKIHVCINWESDKRGFSRVLDAGSSTGECSVLLGIDRAVRALDPRARKLMIVYLVEDQKRRWSFRGI